MNVVNGSEMLSESNENNCFETQYIVEKQESESAQFIDSRETEEFKKQIDWSELPSIPLEKIYSFLEREDQVNMSLVCHKWSEGYDSPSVWNTFVFYLTETQLSMDTCPIMKFVHKYSNMFRYVTVDHNYTRDQRLNHTWFRHFNVFLEVLMRKSQLFSVEFLGLPNCFMNTSIFCLPLVSKVIANFLESQPHLQRVVFYSSFFRFSEGAELLRKLSQHCGNSLKHLVLQGFIHYNRMDQEENSLILQNLPTLTDFPCLKTLKTYYTFVFENMVSRQSLQTAKSLKTLPLTKIILNYEKSSLDIFLNKPAIEDFRGIKSTDWQFLKSVCPNLQVELTINTDSPSSEELDFLISINMPIVRLKYRDNSLNIQMEAGVLFRHLLKCNINDHLVFLELRWECPVPNLISPFIPFLLSCKKLKYLEIHIKYSTNYIDLMKHWLNNPPEYLEKVMIYISIIEDCEYNTFLENITSEYVNKLKLIGINIEVEIDYEDAE